MNKDECFQLGMVKRPKGRGGELAIHLDVDDPSRYQTLDAMFIEVNGILTPFFIESLRLTKGKQAVVVLEGVDSEEQAAQLGGAEIHLPLTALPELEGNKFYFHEVIGFTAIDRDFGEIGTICDIIDNPTNPLFAIDHKGKEVLIPVADHTIVKVDREGKKMHLNAPEGLIQLYLEE